MPPPQSRFSTPKLTLGYHDGDERKGECAYAAEAIQKRYPGDRPSRL